MLLSDIILVGLIILIGIISSYCHFLPIIKNLLKNHKPIYDFLQEKIMTFMFTTLGTTIFHIVMKFKFNNYQWLEDYLNAHKVKLTDIITTDKAIPIIIVFLAGMIIVKMSIELITSKNANKDKYGTLIAFAYSIFPSLLVWLLLF